MLEWVYAVSAASVFTVCPVCSFTVWTVYALHYIRSILFSHLPLPPPPRPASIGSVIKWVSSETSQQARGSLGSTTVAPSPSASGGHISFRMGWICWRMWGFIVTCSKDGYGAGREDCVWMCACREPVQVVFQLCGVWWSDVRCTYVYDTVLWSMSIIYTQYFTHI